MSALKRIWFGLFPPSGFSHPLDDNLPSATSGHWKHCRTCPHCQSDIGHEERMSDICETCGRDFKGTRSPYGARRRVIRKGRWVTQKRIDGVNYLYRGKKWVAVTEHEVSK